MVAGVQASFPLGRVSLGNGLLHDRRVRQARDHPCRRKIRYRLVGQFRLWLTDPEIMRPAQRLTPHGQAFPLRIALMLFYSLIPAPSEIRQVVQVRVKPLEIWRSGYDSGWPAWLCGSSNAQGRQQDGRSLIPTRKLSDRGFLEIVRTVSLRSGSCGSDGRTIQLKGFGGCRSSPIRQVSSVLSRKLSQLQLNSFAGCK